MSSKGGPRAYNLYNFNQSLMSRRCERGVICHRRANYLQRSERRWGLIYPVIGGTDAFLIGELHAR